MSARVVIVGGASMGWASAHHLVTSDPSLDVQVIERDPTLNLSSTLRSDGNVRIQFNVEENVLMSMYAMECLETFAEDIATGGFSPDPMMRKQGNLFLVDEAGRAEAEGGLATQHRLGANSIWLDIDEISDRFPAAASDRLIGGTLGPDDGAVDPTSVVEGYRRSAMANGAALVYGEVDRLTVESDRVTGVKMADGSEIGADFVIVCAGAWSPALLAAAGVDIPVEPVMRTVYVVAGRLPGEDPLPALFVPSGVYAIQEPAGTLMIAWSTDDDPIGFEFEPAPRSRFYDVIWPELISWLPAFDNLEVKQSWAGLYAQNRFDANGLIGPWPEIDGLYMATGFSGHGFQQCHAVGRYLAELITGATPSIDLARLGPSRLLEGAPVPEHPTRVI